MAAWIWILIAIGVLVVLGLAIFGARRGRDKSQRRQQAQELRQQADTHRQQAEERERVAEEQVRQAREARKVAAQVGAQADDIDPDRAVAEEDAKRQSEPRSAGARRQRETGSRGALVSAPTCR
jgi:uncharacterized protein HemX